MPKGERDVYFPIDMRSIAPQEIFEIQQQGFQGHMSVFFRMLSLAKEKFHLADPLLLHQVDVVRLIDSLPTTSLKGRKLVDKILAEHVLKLTEIDGQRGKKGKWFDEVSLTAVASLAYDYYPGELFRPHVIKIKSLLGEDPIADVMRVPEEYQKKKKEKNK